MLRSGEDLIKICISLTLIAKNRGLRNKSNERVTRELYCIEFFFGCGFHNGDNGRFYGRHWFDVAMTMMKRKGAI